MLGIDIGGTKTAVCVGNQRGEILADTRIVTGDYPSPAALAQALAGAVDTVCRQAGIKPTDLQAAGISAPGPLDVKKGVLLTPPNLPGMHHWNVVDAVRGIVRAPVFLNNDGNAAALAEYLFGEYRGTPDLVYCTFSTGMGGGIITGGQLVQGASDCGGEIGHHIIDPNGPLCPCGMRGCWETFVGGAAVAQHVREQIRAGAKTSMLQQVAGDLAKIDMQVIVQAVRDGDPLAAAVWDQMMERMAHGVGNLIMILNPQVIVLGTIAVHAGELALQPIRQRLPKYTWPWALAACKVVPSALGNRGGDLAALAVAMTGLT